MPTTFVIAAGPGIGGHVAARFAAGGHAIGIVARSVETLEARRAELAANGARVGTATGDITKPATLTAAVDTLTSKLGPPDVVVYNGFTFFPGDILSISLDALQTDFETSVLAPTVVARHVAPGMIARGAGTLLFTGGGLALAGSAEAASLGIGKAGLRHLTLDLAEVLEPQGVHVATVTVCGFVAEGSHFNPRDIAQSYWDLYAQPRNAWTREHLFQ